jgi:hypothetical protein
VFGFSLIHVCHHLNAAGPHFCFAPITPSLASWLYHLSTYLGLSYNSIEFKVSTVTTCFLIYCSFTTTWNGLKFPYFTCSSRGSPETSLCVPTAVKRALVQEHVQSHLPSFLPVATPPPLLTISSPTVDKGCHDHSSQLWLCGSVCVLWAKLYRFTQNTLKKPKMSEPSMQQFSFLGPQVTFVSVYKGGKPGARAQEVVRQSSKHKVLSSSLSTTKGKPQLCVTFLFLPMLTHSFF